MVGDLVAHGYLFQSSFVTIVAKAEEH
jgi:hypothetical protein